MGVLTAVLTVGLGVAAMPTAAAQGGPVGGAGNHFYLGGAGNTSGAAAQHFWFGDPGDEVYVGEFSGNGRDDVLVRRGNAFTIRGQGSPTFRYGDPGDTVLVGDWNGDGQDTLAVRRGNRYFVKNDLTTGGADQVFVYGDVGDTVLVGNWDGDTSAPDAARPVTTDTLMVRRGNHYLVTNSTTPGAADYDFWFGDPADEILVGDWAVRRGGAPVSGDSADQLAVRRGNTYFLSEEVWTAQARRWGHALRTGTSFAYGNPADTAFSAQLDRTVTVNGVRQTVYGDGLGVRRHDTVTGWAPTPPPPPAPAPDAGVRTYVAVGDSITAGMRPDDSLSAIGPTSWLNGETASRLELVGGWAVPGRVTADMRANVRPTSADVLVLLGGTNDLVRGLPWEQTAANLRAIADTVGARTTLLVGIVPITQLPAERAQFNARLAALASDAGWRYVDPWTELAVGDGWARWATPDNLHPTPEAAVTAGRVITQAAWQAAARRTAR